MKTRNTKEIEINEEPGCYVDESAGSAEDCNRRTIEFAEMYGFEHEEITEPGEDDTEAMDDYKQAISEIADEAVDFLNDHNETHFTYWTIDDNSLFLMANVDGAKEDCEFTTTTTKDEPDADYVGLWLSVSDHGNATLYERKDGKDTEIWGVV